jgi:hypothetical protein
MEQKPRRTSRQKIQDCWYGIESLAGTSVSMIVRPRVFWVEEICSESVTIRANSGRLIRIPMDQVKAVLQHIFSSSEISLHEARVRYSRDYSEFIFGILARLPGMRVLRCGLGLRLMLDPAS